MSPVVAQRPRVRDEAATPPRVATPTAQPNMIRQAQRLPGEWPPAEYGHRIDEFPEEYGIINEVPKLRPIPSHPNEDDDDKEIPARQRFSTQEEKRMHQHKKQGHKDKP